MQHIQSDTNLQGGKYIIEQKPRYLKVILANPADSHIIKNAISMLRSVHSVNITHQQTGDLTVHHVSNKADAEMKNEVEQTLLSYYSFSINDNITLKQTKHLMDHLEKNSKERDLLLSAITSFYEFRFRHAFDDYRLCIEYYIRKLFNSNENYNELYKRMKNELKKKGFTPNLSRSMTDILNKFFQFQNDNVKHFDNISIVDTMTIFTWGNMLLEQMIYLNKMFNWNEP